MSARKTSARRNLGSGPAAFKRSAPPDWKSQLRCSTALVPLERILVPAMLAGGLLGSVSALANPLGGQVVGGAATISQPSTTQTVINQSSQNTVINWQSFNIPQGSQVDFNQPNSSSVALNRDLGKNASQIAGQLNANGQVWIVNPNGIAITPTAQVNVGGLVATTSNISNSNFLAGIYKFDQPGKPAASVVNQGNITVSQAGLADLVAPSVANSGVIQAKLGKVNLASGSAYTIDLYGDGMIKFAVSDQTAAAITGARVANTGTINAAGGTVALSVSQAESIVDNSINVGGTVTARSVGGQTGQITVDGNGGTTIVSGTLDASGTGAGQRGGTVKVLGGQVDLTSTAKIEVSGDAGGGHVDIGGDFHGAGPDANATNTAVQQGAIIDADAITRGNGGQVAVWSNDTTTFGGTIRARGGAQGGNGGYVETSGKQTLNLLANALVDTSAPKGLTGTWLLDPNDFTVNGGNNTTIDNDLNTTDVLIDASGNINVAADIVPVNTSNANHTLGLSAGEAINLGANINFATNSSSGNLYMNAGGSILQTAGTLTMGGGALSMKAIGNIGASGAPIVTAGVGDFAATAGGAAPGGIFVTNSSSAVLALGVAAYTINTTTGGILQPAGDPAITTLTFGAVTGLTETSGGEITLNNSGSDFVANAPVTISGGSGAIALTGNDITLAGVDSGGAGGTLTLNTAAGGTLTLLGGTYSVGADGTAYSYTAAGGVNLSGANTLDNATTFGSNVTLKAATTLTGGSASDAISFSGKLDGAFAFETNIAALTTFGGAVGGITPLANLTVTGPTEINTATVTTAGQQHYNSGVTLGVATATLTTTNSLVSLGDVSGGTDTLAVTSGSGGATLNGVTAGALTVTTTGVETLNAGTYTIGTGSQSFAAVTTNGTLTLGLPTTFTGAVTLGSATTFDSSAVNGAETFDSTIAGAGNALSVKAGSGNIAFDGAVGASGAGTGAFAATTTGTTTLGGNVYAASLDISGPTSLANSLTVFTDKADTAAASDGAMTFGGNISAAGKSLHANAGNATLMLAGITASGFFPLGPLILNSGTYAIGPDGSTVAVSAPITLNGNIVLDDALTLGPSLTLGSNTTLSGGTAADNITLNGTLNGAFTLNVTGTQTTTFGGVVGGSARLTTVSVAGPATLDANVATTGTQTYSGAVTLTGSATLKTTNSLVDFGSTLDDATADTHSLAISAGTGGVTFGAAVGGILPLASLGTSGTTGTNTLDGNVTTGGIQTYGGPVTLNAASVTLTTTNTLVTLPAVSVATATDALTVNSGSGGVILNGVTAGGLTLTTTGPETVNAGTYDINGGTGTVTFNSTGGVNLDGTIAVDNATTFGSGTSAVSLIGATTLNGGAAADTIDFAGTVDGAFALKVTGSQTTILDPAIGSHTPLASVNIAGPTDLQDSVTTIGTQTYSGAATVTGNVTLTTTNSLVDFGGTVNDATNETHSLSIQSGTGGVTFGAAVGTSHPLASLDTSGTTGMNTLDGAVRTGGTQTYGGPVTLGATPIVLTTLNNGAVTFDSTIAGAGDRLTVNTGGGNVTFDGAVGASGAGIGSLSTETTGTTTLNGSIYAASLDVGASALGSNVKVFTDTADTAIGTDGPITFGGNIAGGANTLALNSGAGAITLGGVTAGGLTLTTTGLETVNAGTYDIHGGTGTVTFNSIGGVDLNGAIALDNPTIFGSGTSTVTLTGDTTLTGGSAADNITLGGTVDAASAGGESLTTATDGTVTFQGLVGNSFALSSLTTEGVTTLASGTTELNIAAAGTQIVTTGAQTYNNAVALSDATKLSSTGGNITFASTVDNATTTAESLELSVGPSGTANFQGVVGGNATNGGLSSLTVDANGTTDLNIAAGTIQIITTGAQTYNNAVTLTDDATLKSTAGGNITFAATVDGAFNLTTVTDGTATFDGQVAVPASVTTEGLTSLASGTTDLNGGSIKTTFSQNYDNTVKLGANTDLFSYSGFDITFGVSPGVGGRIDSDTNAGSPWGLLADTNGGTVTLNGAIGSSHPLSGLDLNDGVFGISGPVDANGGSIKTTGGQGYGALTLSADLTAISTGGGDIVFTSTIDGATAGTRSLTVKTDGTTTFQDLVGNSFALSSLTTEGVTTLASGTTDLNIAAVGTQIITTGAQTYNNAVALSDATKLSSTGGNITFASTVDNATTTAESLELSVGPSGTANFQGVVGGNATNGGLSSLTVDANGTTDLNIAAGTIQVITTGAQTYNNAVTLTDDATLKSTAGGNITFAATVDGNFDLATVTDGTATFGGDVGDSMPLVSITTEGSTSLASGTTELSTGGFIRTLGPQNYDNTVKLGANPLLLSYFGSDITFGVSPGVGGTIDSDTNAGSPWGLGVFTDGGTVTLNGAIGSSHPLSGLDLNDGFIFGGGPVDANGGSIKTTGGQGYGALTLSADLTAISTAGGNIVFTSTIDGATAGTRSLTVKTDGTTTFQGLVGNSFALSSLTTEGVTTLASGTTDLNIAAVGTQIITTGAQTYNNAVALSDATKLSSTGGNITFASTVDNATTTAESLELSVGPSGTATFQGVVGGNATNGGLSSLTVDANGTTDLNIAAGTIQVITTGAQTYNNAVTLTDDATLKSTAGGNIAFTSSLSGAHNLTVTGNAVFDGAVNIASLDVTGTAGLNGGPVTTSGTQGYGGAVTLGTNTVLESTGGGNITFGVGPGVGGTINGGFSLQTLSDGTTAFDGAVGGVTPLTTVTTGGVTTPATGTTDINGTAVTTTGTQTYRNMLVLSSDDTLTGTNIAFATTVSGGHALVLDGNGSFGGAVNIAALTVTGTSALNGNSVTTSGTQTYDGAVMLGTDNTLTGTTVTFGSTVDGSHNLTVSGNGVFESAVGGTTALASLTVTGTSALNGGSVSTVGNQTYQGVATIGAMNTALNSSDNGAIAFGAGLTDANNLSISNGQGAITMNGNTSLEQLTLNTGSIEASGPFSLADIGAASVWNLEVGKVSSLSDATLGGQTGVAAASAIDFLPLNATLHINGFLATNETKLKLSRAELEAVGLSSVLGLIDDIENEINRGSAGETAAQAAFDQRVFKGDYAVDPFALKYNILGLGGSDVPGFNDISYVVDGFWENLIKK